MMTARRLFHRVSTAKVTLIIYSTVRTDTDTDADADTAPLAFIIT
jgi:hypothetical protein